MTGRLALLGVMLATLPLAVDLPGRSDSTTANGMRVEVAGGSGQFAIVSRGCNGEVYRVVHEQLRSGALVVEQPLPNDFVIGVRAGNVRTTLHEHQYIDLPGAPGVTRDSARVRHLSNPYVNPYLAYEGRWAGFGGGALMADQPFRYGGDDLGADLTEHWNTTWHLRIGGDDHRLLLRWMEDVPLESEGHFSADFGFRVSPRVEAGVFTGFVGPYDGVMLGMRGRVWITPAAAAQIKGSLAGNGEYGLYGSFTAQLPGWR